MEKNNTKKRNEWVEFPCVFTSLTSCTPSREFNYRVSILSIHTAHSQINLNIFLNTQCTVCDTYIYVSRPLVVNQNQKSENGWNRVLTFLFLLFSFDSIHSLNRPARRLLGVSIRQSEIFNDLYFVLNLEISIHLYYFDVVWIGWLKASWQAYSIVRRSGRWFRSLLNTILPYIKLRSTSYIINSSFSLSPSFSQQEESDTNLSKMLITGDHHGYSKRIVNQRENTPCIGCYEYQNSSSATRSTNGLKQFQLNDEDYSSSLRKTRSSSRTPSPGTSSSTTTGTSASTGYNLRSRKRCCSCSKISKTEIYGLNEITDLDVNENADYLKDLNSVSSLIDDGSRSRKAKKNSKVRFSPITLYHFEKEQQTEERRYKHFYESYLDRVLVTWFDFRKYLSNDLFGYHSLLNLMGYSVMFIMFICLHFIILHGLLSSDLKMQLVSMIDGLISVFYHLNLYSTLNQFCSRINAQQLSKMGTI